MKIEYTNDERTSTSYPIQSFVTQYKLECYYKCTKLPFCFFVEINGTTCNLYESIGFNSYKGMIIYRADSAVTMNFCQSKFLIKKVFLQKMNLFFKMKLSILKVKLK